MLGQLITYFTEALNIPANLARTMASAIMREVVNGTRDVSNIICDLPAEMINGTVYELIRNFTNRHRVMTEEAVQQFSRQGNALSINTSNNTIDLIDWITDIL